MIVVEEDAEDRYRLLPQSNEVALEEFDQVEEEQQEDYPLEHQPHVCCPSGVHAFFALESVQALP